MAIRYTSSSGDFGGQQGCDQLDEWWEVKGEEHAIPVRGVVDQFEPWFLGGTFRRELMKMIGVGTSFASQTKMRTHMQIG